MIGLLLTLRGVARSRAAFHLEVLAVPAENSVCAVLIEVTDRAGWRPAMLAVLMSIYRTLRISLRSRAALHLEILPLRHQLHVFERSRPRRVRLTACDRLLWVWLPRTWQEWRSALVIVRPKTVIGWHRQAFRWFWAWKSRRRLGRRSVPQEVRALIRTISEANPLWSAPRIHGELLKLGIQVSQTTVAKIHAPPIKAAVANMADLLDESP